MGVEDQPLQPTF